MEIEFKKIIQFAPAIEPIFGKFT